ncbi:lipid-A-disaccharide synthase [Lacibacter cauensis]|uniref:Lipid-A-disaccharide synthase n=1 Tax=Lacibacter cauensis TaxID=510947 RepID=A0A562SCT6_9BACT|nr:lipid-A-disaccharide synthase [Lacibacter cauensis]TWI78406.1 lipid-A-disaccharide synthase [Lacibacter cauensis]
MKYYIIAGEASGDLHGSNLIKELHHNDHEAVIRCWGGEKMQAAGATLVKHYRDLAFMGFVEVLKNIRTIFSNLAFCKEDILAHQPDVLILIDYPGFNLRIAKWVKAQNIRVVYYISPQVWAWKENRVKMMKQCIDQMLVILPFEQPYYQTKWNWNVEYVGHPLMEEIDRFKSEDAQTLQHTGNHSKPIIALLPGSRKQEILKKLPVMLEVSKQFPDYQFIVAKAPGLDSSFYDELLTPYTNVSYVSNQTYSLLHHATAALVTSGTATLETALFEVPEVVCYKGNEISYQIAKRLINIKYISLVNLIMDKEVVKELIQHEMNTENLTQELRAILPGAEKRAHMLQHYKQLRAVLQAGGHASSAAAKAILSGIKAV